jgi:hypothetical protein
MGRGKEIPYETPPVELLMSCLHTLSTIPHRRKLEAMRSTAQHFRSLHESMSLAVPSWVLLLEYAADLEESAPTRHESRMMIPEALPG